MPGALAASNPATYIASQAIELGSTPNHSEETLHITYKNDSLLNFLRGVASGSVSRMLRKLTGNEKLYTLKTTRLYWTTLLAVLV